MVLQLAIFYVFVLDTELQNLGASGSQSCHSTENDHKNRRIKDGRRSQSHLRFVQTYEY